MLRCPWITVRLLQDAFQIGVDDEWNSFPPVVIAKTQSLVVIARSNDTVVHLSTVHTVGL